MTAAGSHYTVATTPSVAATTVTSSCYSTITTNTNTTTKNLPRFLQPVKARVWENLERQLHTLLAQPTSLSERLENDNNDNDDASCHDSPTGVDPGLVGLFHYLFDRGVPAKVLLAVAWIQRRDATTERTDHDRKEMAVERLALYLAHAPETLGVECVRLWLSLNPRIPNGMRPKDAVVRETYECITHRDKEPNVTMHPHDQDGNDESRASLDSDNLVLWELRAKCLCFHEWKRGTYSRNDSLQNINSSNQDYDDEDDMTVHHGYGIISDEDLDSFLDDPEVDRVVPSGDVAAECIVETANWVKRGLVGSAYAINGGIEIVGDVLKDNLTPASKPLAAPSYALTCTDAARQATNEVRQTVKKTVSGIRDYAARGISTAAKKMEETKVAEKVLPSDDSRQMLATAGKVGMASLGAAAIIGEAVFESTKTVAQTTVKVTADVTRHKYGDSAGQVVQHAGDTTGNILRTMTHMAVLKGPNVLGKVVAKSTGKAQAAQQLQQLETTPIDPRDMVQGTKEQAALVVNKLQGRGGGNGTGASNEAPPPVAVIAMV